MFKIYVRNQSWPQGKWIVFGERATRDEAESLAREVNNHAARVLSGFYYSRTRAEVLAAID